MMARGIWEKCKVEGGLKIQMEISMLEIGTLAKNQEKEYKHMPIKMFMMEIGKMM
jgi:hypothetical protein